MDRSVKPFMRERDFSLTEDTLSGPVAAANFRAENLGTFQ